MMVKNQMMSLSFFMYLWLRNVPYFVSSVFYHFCFHSQTYIFWSLVLITTSLPSVQMNCNYPLTWLKLIWKAVIKSATYVSVNDLAFYELDMKALVSDPSMPSNLKMLWPMPDGRCTDIWTSLTAHWQLVSDLFNRHLHCPNQLFESYRFWASSQNWNEQTSGLSYLSTLTYSTCCLCRYVTQSQKSN